MSSKNPQTKSRQQDPRAGEPKPPFPQDKQPYPGTEAGMNPKADHGERSYKGSGKLIGKTAVITGGDSGIGRAAAIAFAREGADVLISYLNEEQDADETLHWVEEAGRKGVKVPGDIRDGKLCEQIIQKAMSEFGHLDILVNNAAYQMAYDSITDLSDEEWDRTFRTNVYAMFYLCRAAVPLMKPGGAIINTASIQGFMPSSNLLAYASTKGAILDFTKSLAKMVTPQGIRVNAVAPGPVWTPLIPSTMPKEKTDKFGADSLFGRPAQPAELAPVYVFLASPEASYVTGEVYGVTGGKSPV